MKVKLKQYTSEEDKTLIEKEIYVDGILKENLDLAKKDLQDDWDQVWFVDGAEGAGKSVLAITLAYYVSPVERRHNLINRVIVDIEEAPKIIKQADQFDAIVIDESYKGMSSTGAMHKLNKLLQTMFTEIRAKNLFVFAVAPTFMDINRYFAIWRSKCLLHVYSDKGERGFCSFFNSHLKKKLYILGKRQFYNYAIVKPNFRFRFTKGSVNQCLDYSQYKEMKRNKNLVCDEDPDYVDPKLMKKCWIKVRENMGKTTKPLTQQQFSEINEMSERSIKHYDALIREKEGLGGGV